MKIAIILGTRPELIKLSPLMDILEDAFIVHTGQHYSYNMDRIFFEELHLPEPAYKLNVGSASNSTQTAKMILGLEKIFEKEKPDIVFVHGDTNTTLAGGLTAAKLNIPLAHNEAGCRSFNMIMQEEKNRIVVDHISDYLFTPTENTKKNLFNEGINKNVFLVGNPVIEACSRNLKFARKSEIIEELGVNDFVLVTTHRAENVDSRERLTSISNALNDITKKTDVVFPIHPRTKKKVKQFSIKLDNSMHTIEPVGYIEFLVLLSKAKAVLTDSGGVQEEASALGTPCLTLRNETEWIETVNAGANILVGTKRENIVKHTFDILSDPPKFKCPFEGNASKKICKLLKQFSQK